MERIRKLLARRTGERKQKELWVAGSGLVNVPNERLNEIPKVIAEHHLREAERAKIIASLKRV